MQIFEKMKRKEPKEIYVVKNRSGVAIINCAGVVAQQIISDTFLKRREKEKKDNENF